MESANAASVESPKKIRKNRSSLIQRIVSGGILLTLIFGVVYWNTWAVAGVTAFAALVCLVELYTALNQAGYRPRFFVGGVSTLLLCGAATFQGYSPFDLTGAALVTIVVGSLGGELSRREYTSGLTDWALTLASSLYIGGLLSYYILLHRLETPLEGGWLAPLQLTPGAAWVFLVLSITWCQDTAAYIVGRALGRHHLAPVISPAKTWEGAMGGFFASILVAMLAVPVLGLPIGTLDAALLGGIGGIVGPIGDLAESLIKRRIGLKDMSNLIPGHGGILDRADSMLFTAPVLYYGILLLTS